MYLDYLLAHPNMFSLCKPKLQADENPDASKSWYPPLEKTLSCLSKLYRCLEPTVFTGLAQVIWVFVQSLSQLTVLILQPRYNLYLCVFPYFA